MSGKICKNCVHYKENEGEVDPGVPQTSGFCLRYPPTPFPMQPLQMPGQGPVVHSMMPPVHEDMWCGEFKRKKSK
jgi:hypothetical protein